jgi:hypothetical protein
MNETERVLAMLEAGNLGMPSRAAQVIRTLAAENSLMKSTIKRVERHLDFASRCKMNPDPKTLMAYFDDMAEQQNRLSTKREAA